MKKHENEDLIEVFQEGPTRWIAVRKSDGTILASEGTEAMAKACGSARCDAI